eukprot:GHRR01016839.1.p1 GENE.GHRR01016839.1~~GHRR01016839.1.p1  ORF type:complete len:429 (+),score=176.18 GHRR01016839.1:945-2231(+)
MADKDAFQVLATFDTEGVGSVNYPQGNPWLVTGKDGWILCSRQGTIELRGSWPGAPKEPIMCQVSPELTVTFTSKFNIVAVLTCADLSKQFQVGEYRRRPDSYLDNVLSKDAEGRLQLDVESIRQRLQTVGSVYTPPGPHHFLTPQPGLGNLKSLVQQMAPDSIIRATISELDRGQQRIAGLTTFKQPSYGSSRASSSRCGSKPGSSRTASGAIGSSSNTSNGDSAAAEDAPYGSPQLTPAQQKLAEKLKRAEVTKPKYTARRQRLTLISVKQLAKLLGPDCPQDTLCAVAVLASWNPVCTKLEHYQLEAAQWELQQEAAGSGESSSSNSMQQSDAARIQLYKVDGSESRDLQQQYGFRTVPMFLMFYRGKLVSAGNSIRTKDEFKEAAFAALAAGRRKEFLPDGAINTKGDFAVLDTITHDMSLSGY